MTTRLAMYVLLGGVPLSLAALGGGHALPFYLAGVVLTASLAPIALFGPRTFLGQLAVIVPILVVVNSFCLWTESLIFLPAMRATATQTLVAMLIMNLVHGAVLAGLGMLLKEFRSSPREPLALYPWRTLALRVSLCALAYVVFYLVFGSLTYNYFTRAFYPDAYQQVAALGPWFWPIQAARGLLMTLAVVPAIATLHIRRWPAAFAVGAILWVAGGLAPLLLPNPYFGTAQRVYHILEILTQNASLGVTAVLLLRPARRARKATVSSPIR
jgi:hypothetical protein